MTKPEFLSKSFTSKAIDEDELKQFVKSAVTYLDDAADLPTAGADNLGDSYNVVGITTVCEEVSPGIYDWVTYDTSGQSLHYPDASGKPTLNGITINGTLTSSDLKLASDNTARTAAETLATTDKIPINDDKYTTVDELGNKIAEEYSTQREFTEDYPFLYFQSDLSMDLSNTTSTTNLVLTNDTSNSVEWEYTPIQSGIIKNDDEINVQFSTSGLTSAIFNAVIEVRLNTTLIASITTTFSNPLSVGVQLHKYLLTNVGGDYIYTSQDSIKVKLTLNKVGGSGTTTIYINNAATESSYLNIRKYIGQSNDTTETNTLDTITLYNSEKNTLRFINHTYAGNLSIRLEQKTSTSKGREIYGSEHEVIVYNNSGSTRTIGTTGIPTSLPASAGGSVENGKYLYFKYKVVNYNGYQTILIITSQSNIVSA